jgi:uncharacterized protein with HEPN domain
MRPEARKYIYDALQAADRLREFTQGKTFADYEADALLRSGVERQFSIIGESLNRLSRADPETLALITDHRRIIAFRNLLVHGYDIVDNRVVWGVLESRLPALCEQLAAELAAAGEP